VNAGAFELLREADKMLQKLPKDILLLVLEQVRALDSRRRVLRYLMRTDSR
jgi:hypothetical protein